jgi:hypothetical protein
MDNARRYLKTRNFWRQRRAVRRRMDNGTTLADLPVLERVRALQRLADLGRDHGDSEAAAAARALIEGLSDPSRMSRTLGLVARGGPSLPEARRLATRDTALARVRQIMWPDVPPATAARSMIESFARYESRQWLRHRSAGQAPQAEPDATWFYLLRNGLRMPATATHVVERLARASAAS